MYARKEDVRKYFEIYSTNSPSEFLVAKEVADAE